MPYVKVMKFSTLGGFLSILMPKRRLGDEKTTPSTPINLCVVAKFDDKMTTAGAVFAEIVSAKVKQTQQTAQFYQ